MCIRDSPPSSQDPPARTASERVSVRGRRRSASATRSSLLRPQILRRLPPVVEIHAHVAQELPYGLLTYAAILERIVDLVHQFLSYLDYTVQIRTVEIGPAPRLQVPHRLRLITD